MALLTMGLDFRRPLRFLVVLALAIFLLLFLFPVGDVGLAWLLPLAGMPLASKPVDILDFIDPLIGTVNGGETAGPLLPLANIEANFMRRPRLPGPYTPIW